MLAPHSWPGNVRELRNAIGHACMMAPENTIDIGDLPEYLQVKLLRAIQEKSVEPLGSQRPVPVDVRILSASHKALPDLVKKGKFREDLYYRLAEVTVQVPVGFATDYALNGNTASNVFSLIGGTLLCCLVV